MTCVCEVTESGTCSVSYCVSLGRLASRHWEGVGSARDRLRDWRGALAVQSWAGRSLSSAHTDTRAEHSAAWWHQATQPPRRPSPWCFRGPCGTASLVEDKRWLLLSATGRRAWTPCERLDGPPGRGGIPLAQGCNWNLSFLAGASQTQL